MSELELRRRPTQARSAATFDHVLATATLLLEDVGWDGFTTNLLAERAGIGVQTLYRYFPNKLSVVATLAEQLISEWDGWFADTDQFFGDDGVDWGAGIRAYVDRLRDQPGGIALRRAMSASHALRALDREDNQRMAELYARAIVEIDAEIDFDFALVTMRAMLEAVLGVLDATYEMDAEQAELHLTACVEMQQAFLEQRFPKLRRASP